MTLQELASKTQIGICLSGSFSVIITFRGKTYEHVSHNTLAYDAIHDWKRDSDDPDYCSYTPKQAYTALWDEVKRVNNLK